MNKDLFRNFYIEFHKKKHKYGRTSDERANLIKNSIGSGKKVLDLGCRDGSLTKYYIDGNEVVGVDIDDIALSICKKNLDIQTFHLDLNEQLPFDNSSFDAVVAGEIIEHLIFPEFFVKEVYRVLRPEGIFCGSTPNVARIKNRIQFFLGKTPCFDYAGHLRFFDDAAHLRYFSYSTLKSLLERYFQRVDIIPYGGHIVGNKKHGIFGFGIPVTERTPLWIAKLFSANLFWKAVRK
jgi:SAM-dependent methyltransferase